MKSRKTKARKPDADHQVHGSSGNVFADMGLSDAEDLQAKASLTHELRRLIEAAGLDQTEAAQRLGIDQPKVSALLRGQLRGFSTERLMRFILAFDRDVTITIGAARDKAHPSVRVLMAV